MISAIFHNNPALLELLLQNGGDVFAPDAHGVSALQHAVLYRIPACASLLLRRGFAGKSAQPSEMRAKALGIFFLYFKMHYYYYYYIFIIHDYLDTRQEVAESQNNDQMVRLLKLEDAATQQAADDTKQQVIFFFFATILCFSNTYYVVQVMLSNPASPVNPHLQRLKSHHGRSLSVSLGYFFYSLILLFYIVISLVIVFLY